MRECPFCKSECIGTVEETIARVGWNEDEGKLQYEGEVDLDFCYTVRRGEDTKFGCLGCGMTWWSTAEVLA